MNKNTNDLVPSDRLWELAQKAVDIEQAATEFSGVSYGTWFGWEFNPRCDDVLRGLNDAERQVFLDCVKDRYTHVSERGSSYFHEFEKINGLKPRDYGPEDMKEIYGGLYQDKHNLVSPEHQNLERNR